MLYTSPILITKFAPGADSDVDIGLFEGIASTPGRDRHGDVVARGAFGTSIDELAAGKRRIPLLVDHDPRIQIGGIKSARQDDGGLAVSGQIVRGTPPADRAYALSKAGEMGLSVGFMPIPDAAEKIAGGGTLYKQVDLVEIQPSRRPPIAAAASCASRNWRPARRAKSRKCCARLSRIFRDGWRRKWRRRVSTRSTTTTNRSAILRRWLRSGPRSPAPHKS